MTKTTVWMTIVAPGLVSALAAGTVAAGLSVVASVPAAAQSAEKTRVRMVDDCVYSEWKHPARRKTAAKRCKCAAKAAVGTLSADERTDTSWGGGLTRRQISAWREALKSCS